MSPRKTGKKSGRKKSEPRRQKSKKHAAKSPKRRRFVQGLVAGKSMRRAALDAGYSESMADNATQKIMPGAVEEFQAELRRQIPHKKLVDRIRQGLDAKETKLTQFEGQFTDRKDLVSWSERRRYAELAAKLAGFMVERIELGGADDAPLNFNFNVTFAKEKAGRKG